MRIKTSRKKVVKCHLLAPVLSPAILFSAGLLSRILATRKMYRTKHILSEIEIM